jgi:hypothetical protein
MGNDPTRWLTFGMTLAMSQRILAEVGRPLPEVADMGVRILGSLKLRTKHGQQGRLTVRLGVGRRQRRGRFT